MDKTVKLWDMRSGFVENVTALEDTLPWALKYVEGSKDLIIGCDSGEIVVINI